MTVAAIAGLGSNLRTGILWLDAHADFNTPDSDASGYLDGQGLSILTGQCWTTHTSSLLGFSPIPEHRVLLIAARAVDEKERPLLDASSINTLSTAESRDTRKRADALRLVGNDVDQIHIHFDADSLDPSIAPANSYAEGGLLVQDVVMLVRELSDIRPVVSATIASWDPSFDKEGQMKESLLCILDELVMASNTPT